MDSGACKTAARSPSRSPMALLLPNLRSRSAPTSSALPGRNYGSDMINNYFVDPNVFQQPDPFTLGNAPRAIWAASHPPFSFGADSRSHQAVLPRQGSRRI